MGGWRTKPAVAFVGLSLFLVIQIGIPVSRMGGDEDIGRFGWQMFSTVGERIEFTVHTADGSHLVELEDVVARARGDIPFDILLPEHLCDTVAGAQKVTWNDQEHAC